MAWGPALSTSVRSQLGSSLDVLTNASLSGGADATSARQTDSSARGPLPPADDVSPSEQPTPTAQQATEPCVSVAPPSGDHASAQVGAPASKVARVLDASPGLNDSRRSSSTMEGAGLADCKADSRMCEL